VPSVFDLTAGQQLEATTFTITPAAVRAYLDAVGDASSLYDADSAPLPPLLLVAHSLPLLMHDLHIPPGTVHGGQEGEFLQPVCAGCDLRLVAVVGRTATRRGQRFLALELEFFDGDRLVCRGRTSLIVPETAWTGPG
jgi:hypothetical protein